MKSGIADLKKILPLIKIELYSMQSCIYTENLVLINVAKILKNHFKYSFKVLTCISAVDYPENLNRFKLVYELLSLKYNNRLRLKLLVNEIVPVKSVEKVFVAATWWEYECWDMFGIMFLRQANVIRILTDYGFQGFPLRKDFPLSGFIDSKYNSLKNRISYENLELAQNYRIFSYKSPWEK